MLLFFDLRIELRVGEVFDLDLPCFSSSRDFRLPVLFFCLASSSLFCFCLSLASARRSFSSTSGSFGSGSSSGDFNPHSLSFLFRPLTASTSVSKVSLYRGWPFRLRETVYFPLGLRVMFGSPLLGKTCRPTFLESLGMVRPSLRSSVSRAVTASSIVS